MKLEVREPGNRDQRCGYRLTVAYDGTDFAGWQVQPGKRTVQGCLEDALFKIWGEKICAEASGRTDTGVHALGQVMTFASPHKHKPAVLVRALNANLPFTIRVRNARMVGPGFHARFHAKWKTYEYRIWNHPVGDPFQINRAWHVHQPLDVLAMRRAARKLKGRHDFASFTSNPGYERTTTVRTIRSFTVAKQGNAICIRVSSNGFLYRMVRNLAGALAKVGLGKLSAEDVAQILKAKKRSEAPANAPACGLYLLKVDY